MTFSHFFAVYGEVCATYPWEVIVAVVTLTTCLFSFEQSFFSARRLPGHLVHLDDQYVGADAVVMTLLRCVAILYSYHQFRNMKKIGSKYILGIAGLFTVFSSFVFTSTVLNVMKIDLVDLKDAIFFFLLLIDSSKAVTLAQFALTATNQEEIGRKISKGMEILGPTITLDSMVEVLVIGIGTLSGVHRLEMLSYYACLSVLVNYVIFMTFYPACLSLILELSKFRVHHHRTGQDRGAPPPHHVLLEENQKANPAVQRVKLIMSIGLAVVHAYSYWCLIDENVQNKVTNTTRETTETTLDASSTYSYLMRQLNLSADHIIILILLVTLIVKFVFFEAKDQLNVELKSKLEEAEDRLVALPKRTRTNTENAEVQTEACKDTANFDITRSRQPPSGSKTRRNLEECLQIYRREFDASSLSDEEVILLVDTKHIPSYNLEKVLKDPERGVDIRRKIIENVAECASAFKNLPYLNYDYGKVMGACCENVVGYVPVPLGLAGPLRLDDKLYYIPMATTEGCLVASTNRGCRAVEKNGIRSRIEADGMTRAPLVQFHSIAEASAVKAWLQRPANFAIVKEKFDSTSRFARLSKITARIFGRYLFLRFVAETGDAMGMNMLSKGTEKALRYMKDAFPEMRVLSLSSNACTDKKPSSVNWLEGRGKSVVCECVVPADVVSSVLKTNTHALVELNVAKNFYGSASAGGIGGNNAQASNIVTAVYIATGQDPAQNVGSSNCMTIMEPYGEHGRDLHVSCTMPSIEVGTVGGGTVLPAQASCLELLGVRGPHREVPGENAKQLARVVCAAVMAGELSLMAAQITGDLVRSHLRYNRSYSDGGEARKRIPSSSSSSTQDSRTGN